MHFVIKLFVALQKTLESLSRYIYWNKERTAEEPLVNPRKRQKILPPPQISKLSLRLTQPAMQIIRNLKLTTYLHRMSR